MTGLEWLLFAAAVWAVFFLYAALDVPTLLGRLAGRMPHPHLPHLPHLPVWAWRLRQRFPHKARSREDLRLLLKALGLSEKPPGT